MQSSRVYNALVNVPHKTYVDKWRRRNLSYSNQDCMVIQGAGPQRPSTQDSALDFLNVWAGGHWHDELDQLNPHFLRINRRNLISSYFTREASEYRVRRKLKKVLRENECVLLRYSYKAYSTDVGSIQYQTPRIARGVELQEILHGRVEGLDRVVLVE